MCGVLLLLRDEEDGACLPLPLRLPEPLRLPLPLPLPFLPEDPLDRADPLDFAEPADLPRLLFLLPPALLPALPEPRDADRDVGRALEEAEVFLGLRGLSLTLAELWKLIPYFLTSSGEFFSRC